MKVEVYLNKVLVRRCLYKSDAKKIKFEKTRRMTIILATGVQSNHTIDCEHVKKKTEVKEQLIRAK